MKIKVPDNLPVKLAFRQAGIDSLNDVVNVLFIGESDMDLEVPNAEAYFQVGMNIDRIVLTFPVAGNCSANCIVKAVSNDRCNMEFDNIEPIRPLLEYLKEAERIEKVVQQTYKPAQDISKVMFNKFMDAQSKTKTPARKKVLIVDDAISVHERFRSAFIENGLDVIQAVNGMEGIKQALEAHPDIILMDVNMPKMTGIEATRIIRSNPKTSEIPICMFTTEGEKDLILEAIKMGIKDYIIKTADVDVVIARVRKLIEN